MLLNWKTLIIAGLRGSTLFAKLLFTILLARLLTVDEFGQWILISAIVTYGIFVLGAELYNLILRNYISNGHEASVSQVSAQLTYFLILYCVIFLVCLVTYSIKTDGIYGYIIVVTFILILEHLTHEFHRLAFFQDHQVHANAILFLKSAGWMAPTGIYLILVPSSASLSLVLKCWLAGAIVAACYALVTYRGIFAGVRPFYVTSFIRKRKQLASMLAPFLIIAVALRTPLLLDRYLIERFFGPAQLGAYGYYATFGNGIQAIFDAVILARLTPQLIREKRMHAQQISIVGQFIKQAVLFWAISIVALYFTVPYLNQLVGKASFDAAFAIMLILLTGQMIFSLASVLHYGLYSLHRDHQLARGAVAYMAIALAAFAVLIPQFGSYGAAWALAFSAIGLLIIRARQLLQTDLGELDEPKSE